MAINTFAISVLLYIFSVMEWSSTDLECINRQMMDDYSEKKYYFIVADILSMITISSCFVIKIPQIRKIQQIKSAKGISNLGLCLELFSYTVMMAYNYLSAYAILSYMEYPILLFQEYILIYFVFHYNNMLNLRTFIIIVLYFSLLALIFLKAFPSAVLVILVPLCTPIGASSKVLQLLAILRTKDSSSVSLVTWALSAFTNLTRIYTIMIESNDIMLLSNFIISFTLSATVFLAALIYRKPKIL
ncbi:solute carrier family 66 member 3 isoform X2 [Hermetia illucens]|uniref:solute carrier family 66 member 3 isoform X2 n=1 Tax=Hermetia illucens TaxID=343691 RepID=UPI0018CC4EB3|nr:solute carrier family 66 member 3 isoform X2 [Hermetia illucens]